MFKLPRYFATSTAAQQWTSSRSSSRPCSSYVSKMRLQEMIKTDESVCRDQLQFGQFLVFHKGKPLMTPERKLVWINYDRASSLSPNFDEDFAFLNVDVETGRPLLLFPSLIRRCLR